MMKKVMMNKIKTRKNMKKTRKNMNKVDIETIEPAFERNLEKLCTRSSKAMSDEYIGLPDGTVLIVTKLAMFKG